MVVGEMWLIRTRDGFVPRHEVVVLWQKRMRNVYGNRNGGGLTDLLFTD